MLHFVIPLGSRQGSGNWPRVCQLLEHTLRSACSQLHSECAALVTCHDKPEGIHVPDNCRIVQVPFAAPALSANDDLGTDAALFAMHSDKGRKLIYGLQLVRSVADSYVMFLDADDLVSNRLAAHVAAHAGQNGWFIDRGYMMKSGSRWVYPRRRFYEECGSAYILRSDLAPFPEPPDYGKDLNDYYIRRYVVHAYVGDNMREAGHPLEPLPFYGAVYVRSGINMYATRFRRQDSPWRTVARWLVKGRRVTPAIRAEFGIREEGRRA